MLPVPLAAPSHKISIRHRSRIFINPAFVSRQPAQQAIPPVSNSHTRSVRQRTQKNSSLPLFVFRGYGIFTCPVFVVVLVRGYPQNAPPGGILNFARCLQSARCCSIAAFAFLAMQSPAHAQSALRSDFASPAFTEFTPPAYNIAPPANFDRYSILPCEYLKSSAEACPTAPARNIISRRTSPSAQRTQQTHQHPPTCSPHPRRPSRSLSLPRQRKIRSSPPPNTRRPTRSRTKASTGGPLSSNPFISCSSNTASASPTIPFLRYLVWHKPFWHDYLASTQHFYFNQWGDGDDFIVNYIGHPLEGAVTGYIQIVNDPKGRDLTFGKSRSYWTSRLRALAWAAVYSANFEAGPILSEAALGNEGGYFYKPGCDPYLSCAKASNKPITNNTGWVDFTITPVVGLGWIILEDAIETEFTDRWAPGQPDDPLKFKLMRAFAEPRPRDGEFRRRKSSLVSLPHLRSRRRQSGFLASTTPKNRNSAGTMCNVSKSARTTPISACPSIRRRASAAASRTTASDLTAHTELRIACGWIQT